MKNTCKTCAFYVGDKWTGRCHRFPPTQPNGKFVGVMPEEWCGEWEMLRDENGLARDYSAPFADLVDRVSKGK